MTKQYPAGALFLFFSLFTFVASQIDPIQRHSLYQFIGDDEQMETVIERLYEMRQRQINGFGLNGSDMAEIQNIVNRWNAICGNSNPILYREIHEDMDPDEIAFYLLKPEFEHMAVKMTYELAQNVTITLNELTQEFTIELFRLFSQPKTNDNYPIYRTLQKSYRARTIDYLRKVSGHAERSQQQYFESNHVSIEYLGEANTPFEPVSLSELPHDRLSAKELFEIVFGSDSLSDDERTVINVLIETEGSASFREIERITGIERGRAKRLITKAKPKLNALLNTYK